MKYIRVLSVFLFLLSIPAASFGAEVRLRSIHSDFRPGTAGAVVVERGALVHTALLYPVDPADRLVSAEAGEQALGVLRNIERALVAADSDLDRLVRLHVYVAGGEVAEAVEAILARRFRARRQPAVTFVESAMPREGMLVMMDAIGATAGDDLDGSWKAVVAPGLPRPRSGFSHASIQPEGAFVVISGRASRGDFEEGVRGTMELLRGELERVGLTFDDVVQIKHFLRDMSKVSEAEEIAAEFFEGKRVPPQVAAEWVQGGYPAEIEVIATGGRPASDEQLEFFEPLSARFSRSVKVNRGRPLFTSGISGGAEDPVRQVGEIFSTLQELLEEGGSDMRHLVKATYYVSDSGADSEINRIRPTLYDEDRPPAASKITVPGTGREGKGSVIDLIAVLLEEKK